MTPCNLSIFGSLTHFEDAQNSSGQREAVQNRLGHSGLHRNGAMGPWTRRGPARLTQAIAAAALMSGCALPLSKPEPSPNAATAVQAAQMAATPSQWQAPLPHGGSAVQLAQWWKGFNDPLLIELMEAAQLQSPQLAAAQARIAQSRAAVVGAEGPLSPSLGAVANLENSKQGNARSTVLTAGVQASWELDVFGGNRLALDAAHTNEQGVRAAWHEARVLVAAELGATYLNHRLCQAQMALTNEDATSRQETARLSALAAKAGFAAPSTIGLAEASAAEAANRVKQQALQCGQGVNALVALTGIQKPAMLTKLAMVQYPRPSNAIFNIAAVPGQVISQRPDVYRAEREVALAAHQIGQREVAKMPRITLGGTLGAQSVRAGGASNTDVAVALGPLTLTLPLLPREGLNAQADAAKVAYEAALVAYKSSILQAAREVEDALASLQSTHERAALTEVAARGYKTHFLATQARHKAGMASLLELEESRRLSVLADTAQLALSQERTAALIGLYRAAGGGWSMEKNAGTAPVSSLATAHSVAVAVAVAAP